VKGRRSALLASWWSAVALVVSGLAVVGTTTSAAALPTDTLSAADDSAYGPQLAADARGNAVAVFTSHDGEVHRVQAVYRPAGGSWGPPVTLSVPGQESSQPDPQVAVDGRGRAVAVWKADGAPQRLQVAERRADGTWSTPVTISTADRHAYQHQVVADAQGGATVVWGSSPMTGDDPVDEIVWAAHRPAGGAWDPPVKLAVEGFTPHLGVDAEGTVTAVWRQNDSQAVQAASLSLGGSWSSPVTLSEPAQNATAPRVAVNPSGAAVAVWRGYDGSHWRVQSAARPAGGAWSTPTTVSEPGREADRIDLAIDSRGNAVAVWWRRGVVNVDVDAVQVADLPASGSWSVPFTVTPDYAHALDPRVAMDAEGNVHAVWRQAGPPSWKTVTARRPVGEPWGYHHVLSEDGLNAFRQDIAVDGQGNAVVAWDASYGTSQVVQAQGRDHAAPVATMVRPADRQQTATAFDVSWSAVDTWSGVGSHDVRYRSAPYDGGFGPSETWLTGTTATEARFRGKPGLTYCFSSRATDIYRRLGDWSAERCTATPVDDRALTPRGAWKRVTGKGLYLGTQTVTRQRGDVLVLRGVRAKQLSLLVTRAPGAGKVQVSLGGEPLGTYGLGSTDVAEKSLVRVRTFPTVRTGTLRIRVVSPSGRLVRVDGVVASRS
jgi:hypothetical protein